MTDSNDALRILEVDKSYAFGELHGCLLGVWRGQPDEASFQQRGRYMIDLASRLPGRCGYLEVIEPSSKPPSRAARNVAVQSMKEVGKSLAAVAMVVEGNELRSTLVRAVVTGMLLVFRSDQPMRVDKQLLRSAEWVCGKMESNEPHLPARLVEAIEKLRASIA
jgi:hypothetical protein